MARNGVFDWSKTSVLDVPTMFQRCGPVAKNKFGAGHTKRKLAVLDKYLGVYTRMLHAKFRLMYVDAFAGTDEILLSQSTAPLLPGIASESEVVEGSAVRALANDPPFDEYVFIEKHKRKLDQLEAELRARFPDRIGLCRFVCADANDAIRKICNQTNWSETRAVIFLDPFGNQIAWETLASIAATKAADLWYLFPSGLGVYRQIPNSKKPLSQQAKSVTKILGSDEWLRLFTRETTSDDLFGNPRTETSKVGDVEAITVHAIDRLRSIFEGGVLDEWVRLGGKKVPWYSLLFACSNPSPAAKELAHKIANWIVDRS